MYVFSYCFNVNNLQEQSVITAEHLLSIISTAFYSTMCTPNKVDPFEDYFKMELNQLFVYFEYSPYLAFFGKMLNILSTFMWTFMDLFVMIISIGLSTQFKKINRHLMKHKGEVRLKTKLPFMTLQHSDIRFRNPNFILILLLKLS